MSIHNQYRGLGALVEKDLLLEALGQQSRQQMVKDEVRFSPVNDPYLLMLRAGQDIDAARQQDIDAEMQHEPTGV